jgi:hypothetical protein
VVDAGGALVADEQALEVVEPGVAVSMTQRVQKDNLRFTISTSRPNPLRRGSLDRPDRREGVA